MQRAKLVAVYFWLLLAHYIVDLGLLVANILVANKSAIQTLDACQASIHQAGLTGDTSSLCKSMSVDAVLFLSALGVFKLIATCMSLSRPFSVQCASPRSCRHDLCDFQIQALLRKSSSGQGDHRSDETTAGHVRTTVRQRRATHLVHV